MGVLRSVQADTITSCNGVVHLPAGHHTLVARDNCTGVDPGQCRKIMNKKKMAVVSYDLPDVSSDDEDNDGMEKKEEKNDKVLKESKVEQMKQIILKEQKSSFQQQKRRSSMRSRRRSSMKSGFGRRCSMRSGLGRRSSMRSGLTRKNSMRSGLRYSQTIVEQDEEEPVVVGGYSYCTERIGIGIDITNMVQMKPNDI